MTTSVVIAGLGVSGLACALELTRRNMPFIGFERENRPGGLARTEVVGDFRLDFGPHILLGVGTELRGWFDGLPDLDLDVCSGRSCIAFGRAMELAIPAPVQRHLNYLPLSIRVQVLAELLGSNDHHGSSTSYGEFAAAQCGKRIYEMFLRPYESKRLRFNLDDIPADWTDRVEPLSLGSLLVPRWVSGYTRHKPRESRFLYPRSGGIEALPRAMANLLPRANLHYGNRVMEIDPASRRIFRENGPPVFYQYLVISLPLPEIVSMLKDPPTAVQHAAEHLQYTSIYVLSIGIDGSIPPWSLIRLPDSNVSFYRLSFPSQYAKGAALPGQSVIMGETSHHASRHPISKRAAMDDFRSGLRRLGILGKNQKILVENLRDVHYGHVIYNHRTKAAVRVILDYLEAHSIIPCGKYGLWLDMLMTHSILSGIEAAHKIARHTQNEALAPILG
jgi:protoporphyrinogen oxidase